MSFTQTLQHSVANGLTTLLSKISPAQWATFSLLTHFEHATALFNSLEEERQGDLVSFDSAFDDL